MKNDPESGKSRSSSRSKSASVTRPAPAPGDEIAADALAVAGEPNLPPVMPLPKEPFARGRLRRPRAGGRR